MKLRNKKTGEIVPASNIAVGIGDGGKWYDTLAELNEEWEDYKGKEPLIKDGMIRRAVRAWAEAIGVDELFYCIDYRTRRAVFSWSGNDMAMELLEPVEGLDSGLIYAVTSLCGEEGK